MQAGTKMSRWVWWEGTRQEIWKEADIREAASAPCSSRPSRPIRTIKTAGADIPQRQTLMLTFRSHRSRPMADAPPTMPTSNSIRRPLTLIVAATTSNGIGQAGGLPWKLSQEMKYFAKGPSSAIGLPSFACAFSIEIYKLMFELVTRCFE